jgi:uncharacterized Zn finger protein (UPF0148 family)
MEKIEGSTPSGSTMNQTCPGCGRPELHKRCPAWGTPYYMSGEVFTEEMEKEEKEKNHTADLHRQLEKYGDRPEFFRDK